jgi:hypothetical protein
MGKPIIKIQTYATSSIIPQTEHGSYRSGSGSGSGLTGFGGLISE